MVSLWVGEERDHGPIVDYFTNWCQEAGLLLNVDKTKDRSIDFRRIDYQNY